MIIQTGNNEAPMEEKKREKMKLSRDQVSWVMNALNRFADASMQRAPMVSRLRESAKLAALLEIMEALDYEFEDNAAAGNALYQFHEFNDLRDIEGQK